MLHEKLKATNVEGTMKKLFEGHTVHSINCVDVEWKSTPVKERFLDLQLDVRGCKDIYASFDKYVARERLDGDNKYWAEGHGMQAGSDSTLILVTSLHSLHFLICAFHIKKCLGPHYDFDYFTTYDPTTFATSRLLNRSRNWISCAKMSFYIDYKS